MDLIYHSPPAVTLGTNVFINVPVILKFDETPLISVVKEEELGFTSEIPIFHADGTYLAKVRGTRVYATDDGRKAGVEIRQLPGVWVCSVAGRTAFEIRQQPGNAFRAQAELHTPEGFFVKVAESPLPQLFDVTGTELRVGGIHMSGNVFAGMPVGIWIRSDGRVSIG